MRVQVHVAKVRAALARVEIRAGMARRPALECGDARALQWEAADLYTLAMDLAEDSTLRALVSQARATMISQLTRSIRRKSFRLRRSSPAD